VNALNEGMRRLGINPPDLKQKQRDRLVSITKEDIEILLNAYREAHIPGIY